MNNSERTIRVEKCIRKILENDDYTEDIIKNVCKEYNVKIDTAKMILKK